jgi:sugar/nucleoside kinase (ribokinase family)
VARDAADVEARSATTTHIEGTAVYWQHVAAVAVERIDDVTGAGDCFAAGCIAALLAHRPLIDAARNGVAIAAQRLTSRLSLGDVDSPHAKL